MSHIIKNELKLLKNKIMENPQLRNDSQLNKQTHSLIECATKKSNIPQTYEYDKTLLKPMEKMENNERKYKSCVV